VDAFWFENGIDFKHEKSSFHPIGTIRFGVKRPNVHDHVLLIVIRAVRMCLTTGRLTARRD
jgi:hypothetical protein